MLRSWSESKTRNKPRDSYIMETQICGQGRKPACRSFGKIKLRHVVVLASRESWDFTNIGIKRFWLKEDFSQSLLRLNEVTTWTLRLTSGPLKLRSWRRFRKDMCMLKYWRIVYLNHNDTIDKSLLRLYNSINQPSLIRLRVSRNSWSP